MSMFSKQDYELINLGVCIKNQADRLGIEHEGVPLEGVVVRIAERALSVVAEEPVPTMQMDPARCVTGACAYPEPHDHGFACGPLCPCGEGMQAGWQYGRRFTDQYGYRRRKAGPWVPVKQEESETTNHEIRRQP